MGASRALSGWAPGHKSPSKGWDTVVGRACYGHLWPPRTHLRPGHLDGDSSSVISGLWEQSQIQVTAKDSNPAWEPTCCMTLGKPVDYSGLISS